METLEEHILECLEFLGDDEFKKFQWHLQKPVNLEGLQPLPKSLLKEADRMDTVDLITDHYPSKEMQIIINVLKKIKRKDLVERFQHSPKGR